MRYQLNNQQVYLQLYCFVPSHQSHRQEWHRLHISHNLRCPKAMCLRRCANWSPYHRNVWLSSQWQVSETGAEICSSANNLPSRSHCRRSGKKPNKTPLREPHSLYTHVNIEFAAHSLTSIPYYCFHLIRVPKWNDWHSDVCQTFLQHMTTIA